MIDGFSLTFDTTSGLSGIEQRLTEELKSIGYGVMTRVPVKERLRERGVDFDRQIILLGVCSPPHAAAALSTDERVSLFLPCSIVLLETPSGSRVRLARPTAITSFFLDNALTALGEEVESQLVKAIEAALT